MNPMQQMKDPAAGVPPQLLPHFHLVSKNRYPVTNNPSLETIVAYLLEAPKVVRESQPVQWQFLDCPQDGTLFLTWQSPELGMSFASDGYVWADQEAPFNSDVRGYTLQMFMHKSGFRPQAEPMASHSRRRYRLLPPQQSMGGPMPDPSLWLIHYSKAAPRDHVAASSVPVAPPIHTQLHQRRMIMNAGAIARKEFMLHDRSNWPTINLPGINAPGPMGRQAPNAMPAAHRRGQSLAGHEPSIEEEEDVSRGDVLDFMTPRDISRMRYEQHHEWMEEILESPYRTMQIIPPGLGLGRKGELETLTKDFFDAPTGTSYESSTDSVVPRVGRLDRGQAEEFTKLANQKLADMHLELQKMKQAHQRRMQKLKKVTALNAAEKKLRAAPSEPNQRKMMTNGARSLPFSESDPVDAIVKEVEGTTGRKIDRVKSVTCVAKGGFQELQSSNNATTNDQAQSSTVTNKPNNNGSMPGMQQQPTPQQQQQQQQSHPQSHPQPQPQPQPSSHPVPITTQTGNTLPNADSIMAQQPVPLDVKFESTPNQQDNASEGSAADIDMDELDGQPQGEDGLVDASDWVMVDDANMGNDVDTPSLNDIAGSVGDNDQLDDEIPLNTGFTPAESADQTPQANEQLRQRQGSELNPTGNTPLDTGDFDFDDVNTAGDALADYGADDDDLNLDTMDDSAFGDAFHAADDHDLS